MSIVLRPYQQEAVQAVLKAYKQNPRGQELIVMATGGGKTIVFSSVIDTLAREYGLNALIIAHRDELLNQAADKYRMIKPHAIIGKVGSGIHQYGGEVTVASIATISRSDHLKSLKALYGTGNKLIIIIDEAHHQASESYQRVLQTLPDAFVLSVTATPDRLDKKQIINKKPLYQATIIDLIEQGYLCDMRAIAIKTDTSLDDVKTTAGDYNERDLDSAINTPTRNRRVAQSYLEHTPGKRGICFGITVSHAQALAYAFNDMGVSAACVEGNTPLEERKRLYHQFHTGEIKVLTNVMVLSEGYDEPLVEVAILARPTQSRSLYVQQVGRVLRLAPGKKIATILDITDNCMKHRIAPQQFKYVLQHALLPNETLLEAIAREENEKDEKIATEKRALIRRLNHRRDRDIAIDPLGLPEWQENDKGMFVMEVGLERHRIALVPCKGMDGLYEVWARLAPDFEAQKWLGGYAIDWAMQFAEKKAHLLLEGEIGLADKNAPWRSKPFDPNSKQAGKLKQYKIEPWPGMTKGEASDLIDARKAEIEARKAKKAIRDDAQKVQQPPTQIEAPKNNLNGDRVFRMLR
jgi:superfamily II DNA or RNA helicase